MKFLQVIPNFNFGGAETMCENLIYALRNMEHEVTAVSLYNQHTPITDRMERQGVRILYLDKKLGLDLSMIPKLIKIIKQEKPDVVHTHLDVVKYAALAAKLTGVRKCIHTVHNIAEQEAEGLAKVVNQIYFKLGWSKPIALSPEVQLTIEEYYGLDCENVPVIFNGADISRCIPKESYNLFETVTILHIGRFNEQKNHRGLLEAFQKLHSNFPQCRLQLIGDGELRTQMEEYAEELHIQDSVQFLGNQANVYPFLHSADIFLLPSLYEGVPMTIIEAMGTGLPIVATAVGGVPDMLQNDVNGLLVPCDKEAICEACEKMILDKKMRIRLGQRALGDSANFASEHMAELYFVQYTA